MKFEIGADSYVFLGSTFDCNGQFSMGHNSVVNQNCRMDNRGGIRIGNNAAICAESIILTGDHDHRSRGFDGRLRPVIIGDFAFLGTRCMILPGCSLGEGCIVAAGSVVTKDVDAYSIVAGMPARKIGERPQDLTYKVVYGRAFC